MQRPGILSAQLSTKKRDVERRGKDWCNRVGAKKWQERVVLVQQGRCCHTGATTEWDGWCNDGWCKYDHNRMVWVVQRNGVKDKLVQQGGQPPKQNGDGWCNECNDSETISWCNKGGNSRKGWMVQRWLVQHK